MFRDFKEYQEIAKLYTEKVSKTENLEENQANRMKMKATRDAQNQGRFEKQIAPLKPKPTQGRISPSSQNMAGKPKPMPTTAEIRAKDKAAGGTGMSNIPSKEGSAVIDGKKLNPNFGKKVDIKKEFPDKPEISKFTKQGKERTKAQMMAAKRIASGKTIADVKKANMDAMRARAAEKFADFKAKREANRMKNKPQNNSGGSSETMMASYTPDMDAYDMVLEYLLSTEQAATIEEANYVMMQLD